MKRLLTLFLLCSAAWGATWANGYQYRRTLTVAASQFNSTQTDFPAVLTGTYADLATGAGGVQGTCAQGSLTVACDLIFTSDSAGSSAIPWEFESYNSGTGAIVVWFKIPSATNGTKIYMFYGKSGVSTFQSTTTSVWDSHYKAVWHLTDLHDSTSHGFDLTNSSATTTSSGQLGGAYAFSSAFMSRTGSDVFNAATWTYSCWASQTSFPTRAAIAGMQFNGSNVQTLSSGKVKVQWNESSGNNSPTGTTVLSTNTFYYVSDSGDTGFGNRLYLNGAQEASGSQQGGSNGSGTYWIGKNGNPDSFPGTIDECRVSDIRRVPDWVAAEYKNQNAPGTFWSVGAATLGGAVKHKVTQQ